jgi:hypothetical protein
VQECVSGNRCRKWNRKACRGSGLLTLTECNDALGQAIFTGPITRSEGVTTHSGGFVEVTCNNTGGVPGCENCIETEEDEGIQNDCDDWGDDEVISGSLAITYDGIWKSISVGWCLAVPELQCCLDGLHLSDYTVTIQSLPNASCIGTGWDAEATYVCGAGGSVTECAQAQDADDGSETSKSAVSVFVTSHFNLEVVS